MTALPLHGMRVIEASAFVAGPVAGLTLAQLGADVVRIDQAGGGPDRRRWPLAGDRSLFWGGLNKGKRSVELDLRTATGRATAARLITAPGDGAGIFLTSFPARGWLAYEALAERRPDLIMVALVGNPDGSSEVDYTVQPAAGFPAVTGAREAAAPQNAVLPAWDLLMGSLAVTGVLAAERHRRETGEGQLVTIALSDVAFATAGNLGRLADVLLGEAAPAAPDGNFLYGAFGCDFETEDRRRVMVVALTPRQWRALKAATGSELQIAEIERLLDVDLDQEGNRYIHRDLIAALLRPWFRQRTLAAVRTELDRAGACWGPFQTFAQLVDEDPRCSTNNPLFQVAHHPGVGDYMMPGSPLVFHRLERPEVEGPPAPGADTEAVMLDLLGEDVAR